MIRILMHLSLFIFSVHTIIFGMIHLIVILSTGSVFQSSDGDICGAIMLLSGISTILFWLIHKLIMPKD